MDRHCREPLLVCSVQVTPESLDVCMTPSETAASFCMRMMGWKRQVSPASMVLHSLAIMPTRRVTDGQTAALNVHGQRGLRTGVRHDDYDGHRRC